MKRWSVLRADKLKTNEIAAKTDLSPLLGEVMVARGYDTIERLTDFFNGSELSDPFLLTDMRRAVDVINAAVDEGERICIFGDYDCDGIVSTAVLYGYLMSMGADVVCKIPEREEGYGLSMSAVEEMAGDGVGLIITVDNGISAIVEAVRIAELGMKLVITDHHQPGEALPEALAVVDPHRADCPSPFKQLCGAGVALKLCAALDGGSYDMVCEQYLDLVAIATVADVVPLVGENRIIVSQGLQLLKNTENLGILALLEQSGASKEALTAQSIAFTVAPRINAASRFGSPQTALDMLISEDESAEDYAAELVRLNARRKDAESDIMAAVLALIDENPALLNGRVLIVAGRGWHRGVIGIVAARLVETYGKPALVISVGDDGESCGSARSVAGFSIFKCFEFCKDLLVKHGGHELAGGLTVLEGNIPELREKIEEYAKISNPEMPRLTISADKLLRGEDLTVENAASLNRIEPCGAMNPEPIFAVSGASIAAIHPLKGGEHTKIELNCGGARVSALLFRVKTADFPYKNGDLIDLMANMSLNEYKGTRSVTLRVIDFRPHGLRQERFFAAMDVYDKLRRGEDIDKALLKRGCPSRSELVDVYKYIRKSPAATFEGLYAALSGDGMNAFKLRIIIDAFCETGLLQYQPSSGRIEALEPAARVDIESSETLKNLRALCEESALNCF